MKNIQKNNQLKLAIQSSETRRDRRYLYTGNYSQEILEKRINQIFEKNKYDGSQKNKDWYIIYINAKDKNEAVKLVEYYFEKMDNLLLEFDDDIEKEILMKKLNEDKDKWFELKNDIEKNLINTQKSTASPSRKKKKENKNINIYEIDYDNECKKLKEKDLK
jgi:Uri superfamily endonuclease